MTFKTPLLLLLIFVIIEGCQIMAEYKPLPPKWDTLFKKSHKEITAQLTVEPLKLSNVLIEEHDLSDITITNAEFNNVHWNKSVAIETNFINTTFTGGKITNTGFNYSTFSNVTFDNVTFDKAEFVGATLNNVTFKNCKIINSEIRNLKASTVRLENSELTRVSFFQSILKIDIIDSKIHGYGEFLGLKAGSSVNIENSFIGPKSEFDNSTLTSFTVKNSEIKNSRMNSATVEKVEITDSKLDFAMADSTFNTITISNTDNVILGGSKFNTLNIEDCKEDGDISIDETVFKNISIRNCPLLLLDTTDAKGDTLTISNMEIKQVDFSNFIVKNLIFNTVRMTENIKFNNAQADESQMNNVRIAKGAKVNMSGSNINFQ